MIGYILISLLLSIAIIIISYLLNRKESYVEKLSRYECGEEEYKEENKMITILYYKIALTYLVFDIETILLLPTAFITILLPYMIYVIYIFVIILLFGLYIEYINNIYN